MTRGEIIIKEFMTKLPRGSMIGHLLLTEPLILKAIRQNSLDSWLEASGDPDIEAQTKKFNKWYDELIN